MSAHAYCFFLFFLLHLFFCHLVLLLTLGPSYPLKKNRIFTLETCNLCVDLHKMANALAPSPSSGAAAAASASAAAARPAPGSSSSSSHQQPQPQGPPRGGVPDFESRGGRFPQSGNPYGVSCFSSKVKRIGERMEGR